MVQSLVAPEGEFNAEQVVCEAIMRSAVAVAARDIPLTKSNFAFVISVEGS